MKSCTRIRSRFLSATAALILLAGTSASVANPNELVLVAPPVDSGAPETDAYQPIADYLSSKLGRKVVYRHVDNWLSYQSEMRKGKFDIVIDGPHFVSWRMAALQHEPLVKFPGKLASVTVVRKDNPEITSVKDLAGHAVCGMAPPNFATLSFLTQFDSPARQPRVVNVKSFKIAYENMLSGKCKAAVLRDAAYMKLDEKKGMGRIIYQGEGLPNLALTASPRLTAEEKAKVTEALLSPEAKVAIKVFLERYNGGKDLVRVKPDEYRGHAFLLKDTWGFELKSADAEQVKPADDKRRK